MAQTKNLGAVCGADLPQAEVQYQIAQAQALAKMVVRAAHWVRRNALSRVPAVARDDGHVFGRRAV